MVTVETQHIVTTVLCQWITIFAMGDNMSERRAVVKIQIADGRDNHPARPSADHRLSTIVSQATGCIDDPESPLLSGMD